MGAILSRYLYPFLIFGIAGLLLLGYFYHKGYEKANLACEREKQELSYQYQQEKILIIEEMHKKTPVERRKELGRYVIYDN